MEPTQKGSAAGNSLAARFCENEYLLSLAAEQLGEHQEQASGHSTINVLVAPDSFKGSIAANEVASCIAAGIRRVNPECNITEVAIADGGEGTARAVASALDGTWHSVEVIDANGKTVVVPYAVCRSITFGHFAILDVAEVVGLPAATARIGERTTRGLGQAIRHIARSGQSKIVIGLGGSSTNDAGAGMLAELAFHFSNSSGAFLEPGLDNLQDIENISHRLDNDWLRSLHLVGLTDVTSPLTGEFGASLVFGHQKGVQDLNDADIKMGNFSKKCELFTDLHCSQLPGSGAAGGIGFALSLLGAKLIPGANFILDALGVTENISKFDWVITGEGRSDSQTLLGKGPALVAELARRNDIPVTLLSGAVAHEPALYKAFDGCFSVQSAPVSLSYAIEHAGSLIEVASQQVAALFFRSSLLKKE